MTPEEIPLGHRCRLVMVDAMFTLLTIKSGSRSRLTERLYRQHGQIDASRRKIFGAIDTARRNFSSELLDDDYWLHVNFAVMRKLQSSWEVPEQARAAAEIHERFLSDAGLFTVDERLLYIVLDLKRRGARLVIASNQRRRTLHELLEHFGVLTYFDAVYTSEELGVRKPNAVFWEQILKAESVEPDMALHIGNSPRSDAGAARFGIYTLIRDPQNELGAFAKNTRRRITGLTPEASRGLKECLRVGQLLGFRNNSGLERWLQQSSFL